MKINKLINNLYYCILLFVPLGWFLNWKYYFSRFESEGYGWIGIILSITLVLVASGFFSISEFLRNKKENAYILFFVGYIILAIYSINCTTAGQYWDQQIKNQELNVVIIDKENNAYWVEQYKEKIKTVKDEIEDLRQLEKTSIKDMSDMWYYKNTGKTVQERKQELKQELSKYEQELKRLTNQNKTSAKNQDDIKQSKTIYKFYGNIFKCPEENIQFIFQLILSIIIESIAQLSIFAYMKIKNIIGSKPGEYYYSPEKVVIKKTELTQTELKNFSMIAFSGIIKKQSRYIESEKTILELMRRDNPSFTKEKYKIIMRKAYRNRLIALDGKNFIPTSEFVDYDFFYEKMCEFFGFNLTEK